MIGIHPDTGRTVTGADQAAQRLRKAITTLIGSREMRRSVGGEVVSLRGLANEKNRMIIINRIHRAIANPANDLADIQDPEVTCTLNGSGFRIVINYTYSGIAGSIEV